MSVEDMQFLNVIGMTLLILVAIAGLYALSEWQKKHPSQDQDSNHNK